MRINLYNTHWANFEDSSLLIFNAMIEIRLGESTNNRFLRILLKGLITEGPNVEDAISYPFKSAFAIVTTINGTIFPEAMFFGSSD